MLTHAALCLLAASAPDVKVEALPDVTHLQPGVTALVGVHFSVPEHWHIYWENPGESGMATTVDVEATKGLKVGALRFPAPDVLHVPGDLTCYGYEGEVVLFVPVTVPQDSALKRARLKLDARWLVCKESCVLGDAQLTVDLRVRDEEPKAANAERLAASKARLPQAVTEKTGLAASWTTAVGGEWALALEIDGADALRFFPGAGSALELAAQGAGPLGPQATLELRYTAPADAAKPAERVARGVLEVKRGKVLRYYAIELTRAAELKKR